MPRLTANGSNAIPAIAPVTLKIRAVVRPCSTIRCCMEGAIKRPKVNTISTIAMASRERASGLNSRNEFLEHAVELKTQQDLRAENEQTSLVERGLELFLQAPG